VDGVSGVDLATVLLDLTPEPREVEHDGAPWVPQPEPTGAQLAARGFRGLVRTPFEIAANAVQAATHPTGTIEASREAVEGLGEVLWAGLNPAPPTPLNVEIGPHRRLVWVRCDLEDFKTVKNAFGGTVNDVVLTVASGALQRFLRSRGTRTEGLELRALVPVSLRSKDEHHQLGNRLALMRGPLPVYIEDPVARLRVVMQAMGDLKQSKQAAGAEVLTSLEQFAPPTILAQASRMNFSTRLFNLIVTNIPGPQFPLYVLGRRLLDLFPIAFLPRRHAMAVAIMSYDGRLSFGLLGDYDAMPDLEEFGGHIEAALAELVEASATRTRPKGQKKSKNGRASSRGRTSRPRTSGRASTAG
jgi:diacylglycerol O-acyltransferase / wax synthase